MKIEIETKYNIGDEVIGYSDGFEKYTIKDILIEQQSVSYRAPEPRYLCTMRSGEFCCDKSFNESELFTADDIYERLGKVVTYPTTTEQARHDINMYLGLKNILWNPHAYSENINLVIKWVESKFPEIEEFLKQNKKYGTNIQY